MDRLHGRDQRPVRDEDGRQHARQSRGPRAEGRGPRYEHGNEKKNEQRHDQQVDHLEGDLQQVAGHHVDKQTQADDRDADHHGDVLGQPHVIGFLHLVAFEPIDEIGEFIRIRNMKLYESGRLKELYILLSAAMRGFIHRNMKFDALYETTEEIEKKLFETSSDNKTLMEMGEILEESDIVKFAKFNPSTELSSSVIDRAIKPVKTMLDEINRKKEEKTIASTKTNFQDSESFEEKT